MGYKKVEQYIIIGEENEVRIRRYRSSGISSLYTS